MRSWCRRANHGVALSVLFVTILLSVPVMSQESEFTIESTLPDVIARAPHGWSDSEQLVDKTCFSYTIATVPPMAVIGTYDGDTIDIFDLRNNGKIRFRVQAIDTPERNKNEPGWGEAKAFTEQWLAQGPFQLSTCWKPSITRIEGIFSRNGRTLAQDLIDAGHQKQKGVPLP